MDTFFEQIVKRRKTMAEKIVWGLMWFFAILVIVLLLLISPNFGAFSMVGILAAFGVGYGTFRYTSGQNVEFEYSVTNGEVDIDKIIAQRKRKRLITIDCKEIEAFGVYDPQKHVNTNYDKRMLVCNLDAEKLFYFVTRYKQLGRVLVVVEPDERILSALKKYVPRQVAYDAFSGN